MYSVKINPSRNSRIRGSKANGSSSPACPLRGKLERVEEDGGGLG
jgi:hypothetical protein